MGFYDYDGAWHEDDADMEQVQNAQPYQDIAYWQAKGYGTNDMFDENGQTKPGWSRTAKGYEFTAPTLPTGGGTTTGGGGSIGGSLGGGITAPFTEPFNAPAPVDLGGPAGIPYVPTTPQFGAPGYTKPPAFSYQDWKAPSFEDAVNSPGYQFREQRGMNGLQSWAAGKGTLNDSNTGKALAEYNQNLASAEYKNVWDRDYASYGMNRSNALSQYNTNYGTQYVDPYNFANNAATTQNSNNMEGYRTQASAGQYQTNADYQNAFNKWLTDHDFYTDQRDSTWSKNWQYANS